MEDEKRSNVRVDETDEEEMEEFKKKHPHLYEAWSSTSYIPLGTRKEDEED